MIKKKKDKIKKLDSILDNLHKNKNNFVTSLFKKFEPNKDLLSIVTKINTTISNNQLIILNNISKFIDGENYHGDLYKNYRQKQINATDYWSKIFFNNNFKKNKKMYEEHIKKIITKNIK